MKRALLIAGGTVGGLGAVLAITPPQLTANQSTLSTGLDIAPVGGTDNAATGNASSATTEPTPAASTATSPATKSKNSTTTGSGSASPTPAATQSAAASPTPSATKSANSGGSSGKATNGTFVGDPYTMRYGTVQVQITINNGKITDAQALQAPSGRDQRYTDMAVPVMRQKTIAAQSSNITGVSGASYTAYAWYISLQSALKKAGWM